MQSPSSESGYNHRNPVRIESAEVAAKLDARILEAWSAHPRRFVVPATHDFLKKMADAVGLIRAELPACCRVHPIPDAGG